MLVHCYQHAGNPKNTRIDSWIAAFPIGDDDTEPVVSVEKQIRKSLGQITVQCIEKLCKEKIGGKRFKIA